MLVFSENFACVLNESPPARLIEIARDLIKANISYRKTVQLNLSWSGKNKDETIPFIHEISFNNLIESIIKDFFVFSEILLFPENFSIL